MKKVLLSLSLAIGLGASAQQAVVETPAGVEALSAKQRAAIEQTLQAKATKRANKTQGGTISQRMSHADLVAGAVGGFGNGVLDLYIQPIFQDSTVLVDFGTPEDANVHSMAQTFDLTQPEFLNILGQMPFSELDPFTVDSLWVGGYYNVELPAASGQYTGDTLIIEIVAAIPSDPDAWGGLYYPAGTFPGQTDDIFLSPVAYLGANAHGYQGALTYPQKTTVKYALTMNDTLIDPAAGGNGGYIGIDLPTINVPADGKVGISVTFKAGYSYSTNDVYYASSSSSSTATLNSFVPLLGAAASSTDDTPYFLEELLLASPSYGISQLLFTKTRYNLWTGNSSFRNETFSPNPNLGWLMDIKVNGQSQFSVEENAVSSFDIYPNPTNGNVTLEVAQGGAYTINVLNIVGQVVYTEEVNVNSGEKLNRDFSNLNKGIYLVNMTANGATSTTKLTIE